MSNYVMTHVETRPLEQVAREEIEAAREAGVDPLEIARTHRDLAYIIPVLLKREEEDAS